MESSAPFRGKGPQQKVPGHPLTPPFGLPTSLPPLPHTTALAQLSGQNRAFFAPRIDIQVASETSDQYEALMACVSKGGHRTALFFFFR